MQKSKLAVLWIFILLSVYAKGQTQIINNLKHNIDAAPSAMAKLTAIFSLCKQGYTLHPDTLMYYSLVAEEMAKKQNNLSDQIKALYYKSYALTNKGLIDSALEVADYCLSMLKDKIHNPELQADLFNQKGRCYMRKNQYKEAISMGYQVIVIAENIADTLLQIKGKTLVGWAYLEMGQLHEALQWHLKAYNTTKNNLVLEKYSILFANLALNYNGIGKRDSAMYFIKKAITYSRKYENLFALSNSLAIEAQLYVSAGKSELAEDPLKEVVAIRKLIGDPFYIVSDMAQLGLFYAHNGEPEKGITLCNEGIDIAKKYKIDTKLFFLYSTLAENYKANGNTEKYAEVLENIIMLKDSVYQKNSALALAEMQAKYNLQKKENLIILQRLDLARQQYIFYGLLLLLLFITIVAWLLFKGYRRRQKIKLNQMQEEEKQLSLKAVTEAEEAERKRIAADLHDNLGAYAASIASNIDHINISETNNRTQFALQQLKNNSQSIVSQLGDTIWALKKDALSLTAISDRIKIVIQRMQNNYPEVTFDVDEKIETDHLLSPSHAFDLFQIIQEAINNALKHSKGSHINISVEANEQWEIIIEDNGKGIRAKKSNTEDGNGLTNMKSRAEHAGWKILWQQNYSGGTSVIISSTTN